MKTNNVVKTSNNVVDFEFVDMSVTSEPVKWAKDKRLVSKSDRKAQQEFRRMRANRHG